MMKLLTLFGPAQEVFQEVYGDGPIVGQIRAAIYHEEHKNLSLAIEFTLEHRSCDAFVLLCAAVDLCHLYFLFFIFNYCLFQLHFYMNS